MSERIVIEFDPGEHGAEDARQFVQGYLIEQLAPEFARRVTSVTLVNPDQRARYDALRERDNLRQGQLSEAFERAEGTGDYYKADELAADLREQAEGDLHEALDLLREVLGAEPFEEEEVPHGA